MVGVCDLGTWVYYMAGRIHQGSLWVVIADIGVGVSVHSSILYIFFV